MNEASLAPHQIEAVEAATGLLRDRRGALLADDVGLGKSFVAAEVMRRFAGAIELVVPASLISQWRETLRAFEVAPRILTHDALANDPFFPVASERLVVVDEAHAFRNRTTRRYAALARRSVGARLLLVTATPFCNALEDVQALVRLLAPDDLLLDAGVPSIDVAFATRDPDAIGRIIRTLIIRRDSSVLPDELQFGELERRVIRHEVPAIPEIETLRFPLIGETFLLRRFLHRRLESSEAALIESARRQLLFYERALAAMAAGRTLHKRDYRRAFGHEEDRSAFQEVLFWELFAPAGSVPPSLIREEMARLDAIVAAAQASPCTKRRSLVELLADDPDPALVFTSSAATARDLHAAMAKVRRCALVTSRERTRDLAIADFQRGRVDVLISTDLAAEGLNLQRAGLVVHYDIPWNPVKLDQRNGRAHRIGQRRDSVRAVYFIPITRESGVMRIVARKKRTARRTLDSAHGLPRAAAASMRPRLASDAAYWKLRNASDRDLPDLLARHHKAGVEMLIEQMSREYLDLPRLEWLIEMVRAEG
jgi:superfamily II DNA or RNA helicase